MNRLKGFAFLFLDNILYLFFSVSFGLLVYTLNIHSIKNFEIASGWILLDIISMLCIFCVCGTIRKLSVKNCGILNYISFALKPDYYLNIDGKTYEVNTKGNRKSILPNGTGGLGMIVTYFFKNIILSILTIIFLPFQILACLISNKYSKHLADYFDNNIEMKKAILPSILLGISLLLSITTTSVRISYMQKHAFENDFSIFVTKKEINIKEIQKYDYKDAFIIFYNVSLSVEKYPNDYTIKYHLTVEDDEGRKEYFQQDGSSLSKEGIKYNNGIANFTFRKECGIKNSGEKVGYDDLIILKTAKIYLYISQITYGDGCKWNYGYNYYKYELKEKI